MQSQQLKPQSHQTQKIKKKTGTFEKITWFICGFCVSLFIIAITLKLAPNFWGGALGLAISASIGFFSYKKFQKEPAKKIASIGMLAASLFLLAATLIIYLILLVAFQGISG